jgi:predicted DNA-binding protein YlxM (UPF0122 family)
METKKIYAVLTGDLIGSSRFRVEEREKVISNLKDSFKMISPDCITSPFVIFRGDSFQGVLSRPDEALNAALIIRSSLLSRFKGKRARLDARIAIGIGTIDYLPGDQVGEGDGEAYRNSGQELDKMKKRERNLIIKTPWAGINEELRIECSLLDALIQRWTKEQAEVILYHITKGVTQEEIAKILSISQPAVFQRLKTGGYWAVQAFLEHFEVIIHDKAGALNIMLEHYNHTK